MRALVLTFVVLIATGCGSQKAADRKAIPAECPHAMTFRGTNEHENLDPAWSPDGQQLAFTTGGDEIDVMDVSTCAVRRVTNGRKPTWSPDGKSLAFERDVTLESFGIFVVGADGSSERSLTKGQSGDYWSPDWSPISDQIVFLRFPAGDLFVAKPDGSGLRRLTKGAGAGGNPAWSSDGSRIAVECGGDAAFLCVLDAGGRILRRIDVKTDTPDVSWSPDGQTLTFAGNTGLGLGAWLLPLKTGQPHHLLPIRLNAVDVDWSPAGPWIAVSIDAGDDSSDLYLVHPDGTGLRRLTKSPSG